MKRNTALAIGAAATLAASFVWHGPGGAGERFALEADRIIRTTLDHYEMPPVTPGGAGPLTRGDDRRTGGQVHAQRSNASASKCRCGAPLPDSATGRRFTCCRTCPA